MKCPKCRVGLGTSPYFDGWVCCPVCKKTQKVERVVGFWKGYEQAKKEMKARQK